MKQILILIICGFLLFSQITVFGQEPKISPEGQKILNKYNEYKETGQTTKPSSSKSTVSSGNTASSSNRTVMADQNTVIGIIVVILIIIIIAAIAKSRSDSGYSQTEYTQYRPRRGFSSEVRKTSLERQGGRCAGCGEYSSTYHFDHKNGNRSDDSSHNCQALCPNCHDRKTRGLD